MGFGFFQVKLCFILVFLISADAMEIMLLAILSSLLNCSWMRLTSLEQALLATLVFLGIGVSSPLWGKICDKYGRKSSVVISSFFVFYFGALSSISPTFIWMLVLRTLVGVGTGFFFEIIKK